MGKGLAFFHVIIFIIIISNNFCLEAPIQTIFYFPGSKKELEDSGWIGQT